MLAQTSLASMRSYSAGDPCAAAQSAYPASEPFAARAEIGSASGDMGLRLGALVLGLVWCVGCVSAVGPRQQAKGEPVAAFPQRGELEALAQKRVKPNVQRDELEVEQWE